jgi:phosphoenolpyruvate carboxykinase (GTP)
MKNTTTLCDDWDSPEGVPLDAILFGGRRATNVPLVLESYSWQHGVFLGATISSEQTAAAEGPVGKLRRDPFAMLPFFGNNMADYFSHWLSFGDRQLKLPRIFQVNWFRKDADGKFLWPGFAENIRPLAWVVDRLEGKAEGVTTPIGVIPAEGELDVSGLEISSSQMEELFDIDYEAWIYEVQGTSKFFEGFGEKLPAQLEFELIQLEARLKSSQGASVIS